VEAPPKKKTGKPGISTISGGDCEFDDRHGTSSLYLFYFNGLLQLCYFNSLLCSVNSIPTGDVLPKSLSGVDSVLARLVQKNAMTSPIASD